MPPADPAWLEAAHARVAAAAGRARLTVVIGTERFEDGALPITALMVSRPRTAPQCSEAEADGLGCSRTMRMAFHSAS